MKVFGRSNEHKRILDSVDSRDIRTVVFYGPKYVGKSLLLQHIVNQWKDEARHPSIYFDLDLHNQSSAEEILNRLATLVVSELELDDDDLETFNAQGNNTAFWKKIGEHLPQHQKLLIVLDSFQPQSRSKSNETTSLPVSTEPENHSLQTSPNEEVTSINSALGHSESVESSQFSSTQELVQTVTSSQVSSVTEEYSPNGNALADPPPSGTVQREFEDTQAQVNGHERDISTKITISESHHELLYSLPRILECQQVKLILGADCIDASLVTEHISDYLHQTRTIQLNPLGKDETKKVLLTEGMEGIVDWRNPKVHERVWTLTSGHPAFVSAVSSSISDTIFQDIGDLKRAKVVTTDMIDSALPQILDKVDPIARWHWDILSAVEQVVLSIIAYAGSDGITGDSIHLILNEIGLTYSSSNSDENQSPFDTKPTSANLNNTLRKLRQFHLVEQTGQHHSLKIPLMTGWILENHPLPEEFFGVVQNASNKPLMMRNQAALGNSLNFNGRRPNRWAGVQIGALALVLIPIVAYLTVLVVAPDRAAGDLSTLVPRIMQTAQSMIGTTFGLVSPTAGETPESGDAISESSTENNTDSVPTNSDSAVANTSSTTGQNDASKSAGTESTDAAATNTSSSVISIEGSSTAATTDGTSTAENGEKGSPTEDAPDDNTDSTASSLATSNEAGSSQQEAAATESESTGTESLSTNSIDSFTLLTEVDVENMVWSVSVNSEEQLLAAGTENGTVAVWDLTDNDLSLEFSELSGHTLEVLAIDFSPQNPTLLASASADTTINLWDVATGELVNTFNEHADEVTAIAFHPDGSTLASGSADGTIRLWDLSSGEPVVVLGGENGWVLALAFTPDGTQLATGTIDGTIQIWDVEKRTKLDTLAGHKDWISSVAYSSTSNHLASASYDDQVFLWDLDDGLARVPTVSADGLPSGIVNSIDFHPGGRYLVGGQHDGSLLIWDLLENEMHSHLLGHADAVRSVVFSPLGNYIASGSLDGMVRLWAVDEEQ